MDFKRLCLSKQCVSTADTSSFVSASYQGVYTNNFNEVYYPIDSEFGLPKSDTAKLMSDVVSAAEKEGILSRLSRLDGRYMPSDLSDEDILSLVPPRYVHDSVDIQTWRNYLSDHVLSKMDADFIAALDGSDVSGIDTDHTNVPDAL